MLFVIFFIFETHLFHIDYLGDSWSEESLDPLVEPQTSSMDHNDMTVNSHSAVVWLFELVLKAIHCTFSFHFISLLNLIIVL